jgi:hypothetical protein
MTTKLDMAAAKGAEALLELRELEGNAKLTPEAFLAEAMRTAGIDEARLREVAAIVEARGAEHETIAAFLNVTTKQYGEPNIIGPVPPGKVDRWLRVYGRDDIAAALSTLKLTAAELLALAASRAVERWPGRFGPVEDREAWRDRCELLCERVERAKQTMREHVRADDFRIGERELLQAERDRGLCYLVFKRWPQIALGRPSWPDEIIEAVAAELAAKRAKEAAKEAAAKSATKAKRERVKPEPARPAA